MTQNIFVKQAKEEAEIRSRGIRMGVSYQVEVKDKDGKLLSRCEGKSDPFTKAWIRMFRTAFTSTPVSADITVTLTCTDGTGRAYYVNVSGGYVCIPISGNAAANDDTYGVRVGTSTTAFQRDQYELQAKIAHGSGSGQLTYGAHTIEDYLDEDSTTRFRILRPFTNNSGAAITVNEIGIAICNYNTKTTPYNRYYLICRDVLTSPQSIPNLATLTVTYRLYISYA